MRWLLAGAGLVVVGYGATKLGGPDHGPIRGFADEASALATAPGVTVMLERWTEHRDAGWLLAARFPRDATLEIVPSDLAVRFSDLLPTDDQDWVAVNGGFYDEEHRPLDLVVSEGFTHTPLRARGGSGVLEADPFPARVVHRDAWRPGARMAIQSIDRIVDAGQPLLPAKPGASRAARTAIAIGEDAVWAVVAFSDASAKRTEDGFALQATSGNGPTLGGFAALLANHLRAREALNLDGAVSTQLAARVGGVDLRVIGERGTVQAVVLRTAPSR